MLSFNEKSDAVKKYIHGKWKKTLPNITMEESINCEKMQLDYINGLIEEDIFLKKINKYLKKNGHINEK